MLSAISYKNRSSTYYDYGIVEYEYADECIHYIIKILSQFDPNYKIDFFNKCSTIKYYFRETEVYESIRILLDSVSYEICDLIYLSQYASVYDSIKITKLILKYVNIKYPHEVDDIIDNLLVDATLVTNINNILFLLDVKRKLYIPDKLTIRTADNCMCKILCSASLYSTTLLDTIISYSVISTIIAMHNIYYCYLLDNNIFDCVPIARRNVKKYKTNTDLFAQICPKHINILVATALSSYQRNKLINLNLVPDIIWSNRIADLIDPLFWVNKFMKKHDWKKIILMSKLGKLNDLVDIFANNITYFYFYSKLYEPYAESDIV